MIGIDRVWMLVVVVMKDRLPLIEELVIRLFGIRNVSCQVVSGIGGHRIKCPGWRTCDADGRRCVVERDIQRGLRSQPARIGDRQCDDIKSRNSWRGVESVTRVGRGIQSRSITEIPAIKKPKPFRISGTASPELHSQWGRAIIDVAGRNCSRRLVTSTHIRNLPNPGVKIDVVKGAVNGMLGNTDDASDAIREVTDAYR